MSTMAGRRNPIHYNNFSSSDFKQSKPKGTKPTAPPYTIADSLIQLVVGVCKKYLMLSWQYRIAVYLGILFGVSIIGDVLPYPKSYFSQSSHFLNQYFVKLGWGWTLICTIPFIVMTSYTYCCGSRKEVALHLSRLGVATFFWIFWTNMFQYIESIYGRCGDVKYSRRSKCLEAGSRWSGFDISGHSFLLIYSVLIMIEEAKPIQGWLNIQIELDNEKHAKLHNEKSGKFLQNISVSEIRSIEKSYQGFRRPVCFNFIGLSVLCLIWDLMILTTAMYYHTMFEKVMSGLIAIGTWSFTYHGWFTRAGFPPMPGAGKVKYFERKTEPASSPVYERASSVSNGLGKWKK